MQAFGATLGRKRPATVVPSLEAWWKSINALKPLLTPAAKARAGLGLMHITRAANSEH